MVNLDKTNLILKYALKNAVDYNGRASFNSVLGKILQEKPELKQDINKLSKEINDVIKKVNSMSLEKQKSQLKNYTFKEKKVEHNVLPELPNVSGKVITRIAPYPSGPLHIGNARPSVL